MADPTGLDYASLLGGGLFDPSGNFDPSSLRAGQSNAGLMGLATGLLNAGGASRLPVTLGAALGQGFQGAQSAQSDYIKNALYAANISKAGYESQMLKAKAAAIAADAKDPFPGFGQAATGVAAPAANANASPDASNGGASSTAVPGNSDTVRSYYQYLTGPKGLSPQVAAGILGNVGAESGFDPTNDRGDGGTSIGLFMHHADRADALKAYAAAQGKPWTDPYVQMDFAVDQELPKMAPNIYDAKTAGEAATIFQNSFEKPKNDNSATRARIANNILMWHGGTGAAANSGSSLIPNMPSQSDLSLGGDSDSGAVAAPRQIAGTNFASGATPQAPPVNTSLPSPTISPVISSTANGATQPPSRFQVAEGDSIGVGLRSQGMLKGNPVGGRNPQAVLDNIGANLQANPDYYRGQKVILSSGVMNGPDGISLVPQQIDAIRKAGGNVVLAGADQGKFAGLNPQLAQIAQNAGVPFAGPLPTNDVHPSPQGYRQYLGSATPLLGGTAPASPATAPALNQQQPAPAPSQPMPNLSGSVVTPQAISWAMRRTANEGLTGIPQPDWVKQLAQMAPGMPLSPQYKAQIAAAEGWAGVAPANAKSQFNTDEEIRKAAPIAGAQNTAQQQREIAVGNNNATNQRVTEGMKPDKIEPTQTMVFPPGSPGAQAFISQSQQPGVKAPDNVQIGADGSVRVMGGNPTNSQIDETQKDFFKLKDEATAAREGLYKAQLLRQQLHAIGTSGPLTEHLGDLGALAQQVGVPEETVQKYLGVRPASVEAADKLSQDLLGEVLKQTFPQRITNADITAWKNTVPRGTMLQDAYDLLLDKTVNPKFERSVARYGAVAGLPATDPQLHTYTQSLESFDKANPMDSFVRTYAYGPNGHRLMLDKGQWVDETTRRPVQQ